MAKKKSFSFWAPPGKTDSVSSALKKASGGRTVGLNLSGGASRATATPRPTSNNAEVHAGLRGNSIDAANRMFAAQQQASQPQQKTFADYLAAAQQYAGVGGVDYSSLMNRERANAGESTARIAAMYKQLQGSYAADAPGIATQYDKAGANTKQNGTEATAGINEAYNGTRDAVSNQLAKLGIGDAAAVLASQGSNAANDQARALSGVASNSQGNQNNLVQHKASAQTYNTGIKQAAGLEGTLQQSVIQKQLNDALANLDLQSQQQRASQSQNAFTIAQQLQSTDQNNAMLQANGGLTYNQKAVNDAAMAKIATSASASHASQAASAQQKQAQTYLALLKQYNGDEAHAKQTYKQMVAAHLI